MDPTSFYRAVDAKLCQGDILERVPHVFLKDQPRPLRPITLPGKKSGFQIDDLPPGELPTTDNNGISVATTCHVTRALLLTYDCEIDNDKKHRLVALIRPLPKDWDQESRTILRDGRNYSYFYLPPGDGPLAESYVDFRRICTLSPLWVDSAKRLASLTTTARQAMLLQFFRFLSRVDLDPRIFEKSP
jgi:hypothetical protein